MTNFIKNDKFLLVFIKIYNIIYIFFLDFYKNDKIF